MKKRFVKITSLFLTLILSFCVVTCVPSFSAEAKTDAEKKQEIQNEINRLENEKKAAENEIKKLQGDVKKQNQLKSAIEKQMAIVQKEIDLCNSQIDLINTKIAANKTEINKKNAEIESDKLEFKKRLRAIYMSNSNSGVQILMGAEDFSQFLQLSQLTASVSARDKFMIEKIVDTIETLEAKQIENNKLLEEQKKVKATVTSKQQDLQSKSNQIQSVITSINSDIKDEQAIKTQKENAIKAQENEMAKIDSESSKDTGQVYDGGAFLWPTPSVAKISSPFGWRWSRMHNGVDISDGSFGKKIVAIADGTVTYVSKGCTHNYRKSGNIYWDKCGGGYGNYVIIDHGRAANGTTYKAWYAHMSSVSVSTGQKVKRGQTIGSIGSTGYSTGPHLHFGLKVNNVWKNPMNYYTKVK